MSTITGYFNDMDDPRTGNARRHEFCDIMTISLLCVLCGGETAVDMADFAAAKEDFLREFLELPHGPPCHDTFSRLFGLITPASFQQLLDKFRADFAEERDARSAIAIDGKEMRRAFVTGPPTSLACARFWASLARCVLRVSSARVSENARYRRAFDQRSRRDILRFKGNRLSDIRQGQKCLGCHLALSRTRSPLTNT